MDVHPGDVAYVVVAAPPQLARIRYYLGGHLPERYRAWVERDIALADWPFRKFLTRMPVSLLFLLPIFLVSEPHMTRWLIFIGPVVFAISAWISYAMREMHRLQELNRHRRYWKEH